jgi:hypothetical protein
MKHWYKILSTDGEPVHGGEGVYPAAGVELPHIADPEPCKRGYHLTDAAHLVEWIPECDEFVIWKAKPVGKRVEAENKVACESCVLIEQVGRMDARKLRLFACDCAERVLPIFEKRYPGDNRPREAIRIARLFDDGLATAEELDAAEDAAGDAVWDAAEAAARDAAGAAAWAAAGDAAGAAARAAARAAAGDAVWDAAWAAAWDAERKWQGRRLLWYAAQPSKGETR